MTAIAGANLLISFPRVFWDQFRPVLLLHL
jgi:hypothetical protein